MRVGWVRDWVWLPWVFEFEGTGWVKELAVMDDAARDTPV
jgi:hypothetical protein